MSDLKFVLLIWPRRQWTKPSSLVSTLDRHIAAGRITARHRTDDALEAAVVLEEHGYIRIAKH